MRDILGDMVHVFEQQEAAFKRIKGMLDAMTEKERAKPELIDPSRRRRIAEGSGAQAHEVEQFLVQFEQVRAMMRNTKFKFM